MTPDIRRFGPRTANQEPEHETIAAILLDPVPPFDVDWQVPAHELRLPERLARLARVTAILPSDNAENEKTTHDKTLENYIRLALSSAGDRATLDRFLCHVQAVLDSGQEGVEALAQQVFWIWAPAAEIADLNPHKGSLEDSALRVLKPDEYQELERAYDAIDLNKGLLKETRNEIEELIKSLDIKAPFSYEIQHRLKSKYSAWRKMQLEKRDDSEVFDLMGFRIVIDGGNESMAVGQCRYILSAMEDYFESSPQWRKDYIANPKPNGYRSLHQTFTLPGGQSFELQLRTRAMQDEAKKGGLLTHQAYDATNKVVPGKIRRNFVKVPKLYRWRDHAALSIQQHGGRTEGILGDNILFFKNDGNLYTLPAEATALDASFRIHSRRALKTWTIRRNGKPVSLADGIEHGDVLRVSYRNRYPVDISHLDRRRIMMKTEVGRRAIESYKRKLQAEELQKVGRSVILSMLPESEVADPLTALSEEDRTRLAKGAGVPSFEKLLEIIGNKQKSGKPGRVANLIRVRLGLPIKLVKVETRKDIPLSDQQVLERIVLPSRDKAPVCRVAGCCSDAIRYQDQVVARPSERYYGVMQLHLTGCNNVPTTEGTISCEWS